MNKSIKFSERMVKAISEGKKTQTRRVLPVQPEEVDSSGDIALLTLNDKVHIIGEAPFIPAHNVGDIFCVQESLPAGAWRETSIKLKITSIKVQRLLAISEDDAVAEGFSITTEVYPYGMSLATAAGNFQAYWYELYGDDPIKGLDANPYVFVYEFEVLG